MLLAVTAACAFAIGATVWNAVAAGSGTTGSARGGSETTAATSAATQLAANAGAVIDATAVGELGRLAWVQSDGLALYLGPDQPLREVTVSGSILQLAWSSHGERLAFLVEQGASRTLRWVSAVGGAVHDAGGLGQSTGGSGEAAGDSVHMVADLPGTVGSFAWLADGSGWVVSVTLPADNPSQRSDALYVVPIDSGEARQIFVAAGDGLRLAGPVSATGRFAYWRDPLHSASLAADGLPLFVAGVDSGDLGSVDLASGDPGLPVSKPLLTTLPYPGWVSWSPDGTRLLVVDGSGRDARQGKRLALCDTAAATCVDLPQPPGSVSLDPAFSPDGTRIAFVRASAASRTLVIARPDGSDVHPLPNAGTGVEAPLWADRSHVLYWRDEGLWLLAVDDAGASPVRVRSGETGVHAVYFGYADPWAGTAWQVRP